ncbi:MAG: hypothetical protein O3A13_11505 [Proteobacteria bacterium]|nr:hypothetical protein [Pseudomonadota bacterium]MDA0994237.1 hypothetical protein [Pseudomonadota bacterium]
MVNPNIRANEIVAMFQKRLNTGDDSEIAALSIEDIQSADEQLGDRDVEAGFRIAMRNRIAAMQAKEQRAWDVLKGIAIGVVVTGLGVLFFGR